MKNKVSKSRKPGAIVTLTILCLLIAFCGVFTFVSFSYGDNDYKEYVSVVGAIKLGIDLKGGVYVVMEPSYTKMVKDSDGNSSEVAMTEEEIAETDATLDESMDAIVLALTNRLTAKGYTEATVQQQISIDGKKKIRIEIPDVDDPSEALEIIGQQATLEFYSALEPTKVVMTGENIEKAFVTYDTETSSYVVAITVDDAGKKAFQKATAALVNSSLSAEEKVISIELDGEVISAPTVSTTINQNNMQITGNWTGEEGFEYAQNLAMLLTSGSLPVRFAAVEPRTMSATLGENALQMSLLAGAIGLALVMVFMAIYYKGLGVVADIALLIYIILLLFLMSQIPLVQLTLPGIAGIILSIGMAVDANVVIFERIRDEAKKGKSAPKAVQDGFKRATAAIVDANITTIIAAVVLFFLGTGTIQGFATTLFLGIVVSMFTALLVTRWLIQLFLKINDTNKKFYGLKEGEEINA